METLKCFECKVEKNLNKFKDNKRKYQIRSNKGKCIVCKLCSFVKALDTMSVVRYIDSEQCFKVINFNEEYEVLDFFKKEEGEF